MEEKANLCSARMKDRGPLPGALQWFQDRRGTGPHGEGRVRRGLPSSPLTLFLCFIGR